jgi:two-component system, OmpR family, sensor kinase
MKISFFNRLYVRLWLAVLAAVLVLSLLLAGLMRYQADRIRAERLLEVPPREVVLRNTQGQVLGQALVQPVRVPKRGVEFQVTLPENIKGGDQLVIGMPPRQRASGAPSSESIYLPEQSLRANWARWLNPSNPVGAQVRFVMLLVVFAAAVALGSYPVVRKLTRRLEQLQRGVERLGAGDLRARVQENGHDEVAFLAQRFNRSADQIEALVQSNKSLLANASHELRSPLARIRMALELMDGSPSAALKAELARNLHELDTLIDEILLASRLDAAQHHQLLASELDTRESVDLMALAAEEGARLGVELLVAPSVVAQGAQLPAQAKLLRRLLRNLLENAQRYGYRPDGVESTEPGITLQLDRDAQSLVLEVGDRGPGVPPEERERIFEPFYRASHASESSGGVGLGLALVKSIAQQHGGQVQCLARQDGRSGARFVVHLPLPAAA